MKCCIGKRCKRNTENWQIWAGILWEGKFYCLECAIKKKIIYAENNTIHFKFK